MKKNKAQNKIEVSHNPDTGYVFIKSIAGEVTAEELEKAKRDYYAKAKQFAAQRAQAMKDFDAQYLKGQK